MPMNKKKIFKLAKGYFGRAKNCNKIARSRVEKGLQYQYRDRRNKKRIFTENWIQSINAGVRQYDLKYSRFMFGLELANLKLNRKMLSELAINEPYSFKAVTMYVKNCLNQYEKNQKLLKESSITTKPLPTNIQGVLSSTISKPPKTIYKQEGSLD